MTSVERNTGDVRLPISAKVERRERRIRIAGFVVAYGGMVLALGLALTPLIILAVSNDLSEKSRIYTELQEQWEGTKLREGPQYPQLKAAFEAAIRNSDAAFTVLYLRAYHCVRGAHLSAFASLCLAIAIIGRAPKRAVLALAPQWVREDLAATLIKPEEVVDALLRRHRMWWLLVPMGGDLVAMVVAAFATFVPRRYDPGLYDPTRRVPESAFLHDLWMVVWDGFPVYGGVALCFVYLLGVMAPFWYRVGIRIRCLPRSDGAPQNRLVFLIGEFAGLLGESMGLVGGLLVWGLIYDIWSSEFRGVAHTLGHLVGSIALNIVCAGMLVYLVTLHVRALRDQRRKLIDEVYRFE